MQRTPRSPRSRAKVSPTGPAPTMITWVSIQSRPTTSRRWLTPTRKPTSGA